jgi:hypothetical protein
MDCMANWTRTWIVVFVLYDPRSAIALRHRRWCIIMIMIPVEKEQTENPPE